MYCAFHKLQSPFLEIICYKILEENIEYRTRNFEFRSVVSLAQRKDLRRVSLFPFISIKMIEYLTSTFIIQYSTFDIHSIQADFQNKHKLHDKRNNILN